MLDTASSGLDALTAEREQLDWQVRELQALGFSAEEWLALNDEHKRLAHAASLVEGVRFSLQVLAEGDAACQAQVGAVANRLECLSEYDPALSEVAFLVQSARTEISEAISALRRYADRVELDPRRLAELDRRIEAVLGVARKFRFGPEDLPGLLARWQERLAVLGEAADITGLTARVASTWQQYEQLAQRLSGSRAMAAEAVGREVSQVMQQLALGGDRFEVGLLPVDGGNAAGLEQIEFRVAGLAGSEPRPLAKVASGGEISRISLAIQVVTSQAAHVPTLIFDEVDVGIGGGVAEIVGRLLRELGAGRQVLCVTHLPQVAARANWQWRVSNNAFLNWVLGQRFMPPIAILIPLVTIYKSAGLRDTDNLAMGYLGLMLIYALMNLPIAVLLMKSFFDDVPKDVDEAAMIDGATRWQTFRKVVLPMVRGGVAASGVLCFIFSWTEFLLSLFLTTDIRTVPVKIQTFVTSTGNEWGFIAALGTAAIVPSFIFILLVQKHLVRGLTLGSLKE